MKDFYVIADTHFNDDNIRCFENRPYSSVGTMNENLIRIWNETVSNDDTIYVLGDFISGRNKHEILNRLNGNIVLIVGNHDVNDIKLYREYGITVYEHPIVVDDFYILSHEPMYVSQNAPYANVFGHVHNNPMYKTITKRSYCVSAERLKFKPIKFSEIKNAILNKNTEGENNE